MTIGNRITSFGVEKRYVEIDGIRSDGNSYIVLPHFVNSLSELQITVEAEVLSRGTGDLHLFGSHSASSQGHVICNSTDSAGRSNVYAITTSKLILASELSVGDDISIKWDFKNSVLNIGKNGSSLYSVSASGVTNTPARKKYGVFRANGTGSSEWAAHTSKSETNFAVKRIVWHDAGADHEWVASWDSKTGEYGLYDKVTKTFVGNYLGSGEILPTNYKHLFSGIGYYAMFSGGSSQYASTPFSINGRTSLSFGGWAKVVAPAASSSNCLMFGWSQTGSFGSTFIYVNIPSQIIAYRIGTGSSATSFTCPFPNGFNPRGWNHYCVTFGGGYVCLYVNGVNIASNVLTTSISSCDSSFRIASFDEGTLKYATAGVSRVFVGRELSASDVAELYSAKKLSGRMSCIDKIEGAWNFDEGTGTFSSNVLPGGSPMVMNDCSWRSAPNTIQIKEIEWADTNFQSNMTGSQGNPIGAYAMTDLTWFKTSDLSVTVNVVSMKEGASSAVDGEWNFIVGAESTDNESFGFKLRAAGNAIGALGADATGMTMYRGVAYEISASKGTLSCGSMSSTYSTSTTSSSRFFCIGGAELCKTRYDGWKRVWKGLIGGVTVRDGDLLIGDFVPAVSKSTGDVGFYDRVTREFFTSVTSFPLKVGTLP